MRVDSEDGLHASAQPGLTHDILVSRTSVRPEVCNQVTGRCKEGCMESPPANKLHLSTQGGQTFFPKPVGLEACNLPMAPTSSYKEEEIEAFYMNLERLYGEDNTFSRL
ncbi:hypothetical protein NECAME_05832 [Necator americanus]|uniref:Uncharacterized protein n=1 Tax=Necator americanus TaxID=51031 RepID=W2TYK3_NECAM|nr:hypothetical protein NECAME_05832 [Necator americanus]ETN86744.1 hypothetical protein NECAME_05832 [Necator americanus]